VLPELKGKLDGDRGARAVHGRLAGRPEVPREEADDEGAVNAAMKRGGGGPLKGILEYCEDRSSPRT
jgi:hypothetical protein